MSIVRSLCSCERFSFFLIDACVCVFFVVVKVDDEEKTKEPEPKRQRIEKDKTKVVVDKDVDQKENGHNRDRNGAKRIESGDFTKVPTELFRHIFKFLSSEVSFICILKLHISHCSLDSESKLNVVITGSSVMLFSV